MFFYLFFALEAFSISITKLFFSFNFIFIHCIDWDSKFLICLISLVVSKNYSTLN